MYVAEAHAEDEWPLGNHVSIIKKHTTLEERAAASQRFRFCDRLDGDGGPLPPMPMAVDGMDDAFVQAFACHPERTFVLRAASGDAGGDAGGGPTLLWKARAREGGYDIAELRAFLEEACKDDGGGGDGE